MEGFNPFFKVFSCVPDAWRVPPLFPISPPTSPLAQPAWLAELAPHFYKASELKGDDAKMPRGQGRAGAAPG